MDLDTNTNNTNLVKLIFNYNQININQIGFTNEEEYDRCDSFPPDYEQNRLPSGL